MPSRDELTLQLETILFPITTSMVIDFKEANRWIESISYCPANQVAKAIKFVKTQLCPVFDAYQLLYEVYDKDKWELLENVGEDLEEVVELRKRRKEVKRVWSRRPRVKKRSLVEIQEAKEKVRRARTRKTG
jgi:hypothetical protein